jgi:hypothetical protein
LGSFYVDEVNLSCAGSPLSVTVGSLASTDDEVDLLIGNLEGAIGIAAIRPWRRGALIATLTIVTTIFATVSVFVVLVATVRSPIAVVAPISSTVMVVVVTVHYYKAWIV